MITASVPSDLLHAFPRIYNCKCIPSDLFHAFPRGPLLPTGRHQSAVCAQTGIVRGAEPDAILLYLSVPTQSLLATLVTYSWLKGGDKGPCGWCGEIPLITTHHKGREEAKGIADPKLLSA